MIFLFVFRLSTFTSKVSNLLLPFGAEGTGGFESYPTSEISNKYFYDTFLMTNLPILLLFFFSLFGPSKELIGDSQRL